MFHSSMFNVEDTLGTAGEHTVICNLLSRGIQLLPTATWRRLCQQPIEGLSEAEQEDLDRLKREGFIVSEEIDERYRARWFVRRALANRDAYGVVISPTLECNLSCRYCYESSPGKAEGGLSKGNRMSLDTAEATVEWIKHMLQSQIFKTFSLGFFGGEPMLNPDVLQLISREVGQYCLDQGIELYLHMTSNGTLLTLEALSEIVNLAHAKFTSIQLTIDGPPRIHNARKPTKPAFGAPTDSFDRTFRNLKEMADTFRPSVRVNLDKHNLKHIKELLTLFNEAGLHGKITPYFYPTQRCNRACDQYVFADDDICSALAKAWDIAYDLGYRAVQPLQNGLCADVNGRSINIGPDGNLYSCQAFTGVSSFSCGHVSTLRFNDHYLEHLNLNPWEKCIEQGCNVVTICAGGCRERAFEELGDWKSLYCKPELLENAMRLFMKHAHRKEIEEYLAEADRALPS